MNSFEDFNLAAYHQVLFQDNADDPIESAEIQRKCLAQTLKSSFAILDNSNTCYLLESRLKTYSATVNGNGENIYESQLRSLIGKSRIDPINLNSNLGKINPNSLLKPLPCSGKNNCTTSEDFGNIEFQEFCQAFRTKRNVTPSNNASKNESKWQSSSREFHNQKVTEDSAANKNFSTCFKTARDELQIQNIKKYGSCQAQQNSLQLQSSSVGQKRKLGSRRNINSKFVSPLLSNVDSNEDLKTDDWPSSEVIDDRLKNIDPKMVELIRSEIMDSGAALHWDDIAGLSFAKSAIQEAVVWPMLRPDIFTGLRRPPKGILLFGPPGTGKTLIGKCVASQSKSTFFSISASSLTSKWVGDGEKMVRALFTVARVHQPAVIFIDEVDSLLSQRSDSEHESSRRIKTEFLVQLDGATTDSDERLLVVGATNRPQELDEAARRRFVKRLYIPLPDQEARLQLVTRLMAKERHSLTVSDLEKIASLSAGYSGADLRNVCAEASLGPIRSIDAALIERVRADDVRPLEMRDFEGALGRVRSSVSPADLERYVSWDGTYGSGF
ncbi:unnamed protein product [Phaedon cochleariae]|uniref:Fidgetin-like protein 1 n=1 Tax=Phaedon cochleariae TaxID=80249 RepID=A0A9P0DQC5_PHACE|nr:unnamed protein product [Phaedon cochleariae]